MKILIAEDDYASRAFLSNIMSKYGQCDLTVDGIEALDAYFIALEDNEPYDIICLDIMMPKVDGLKVYKTIRASETERGVPENQRVKVIVTSALANTTRLFSEGSENDVYLVKPITVDKIVEVLTRFGVIR
ncbi:MAG: response regulator [Bacillota bacterium]